MKPFILGLTGSMAMGKSTAARVFARMGIPVLDSDAIVHNLFLTDQSLAGDLGDNFAAAVEGGLISRNHLRALIKAKPELLARLESVLHPKVFAAQRDFYENAAQTGQRLIVFDIPLLFETESEKKCDAALVVTAPRFIQYRRIRARGIDAQTRDVLLARQMPDNAKRARADYVLWGVGGEWLMRLQIYILLKRLNKEINAEKRQSIFSHPS